MFCLKQRGEVVFVKEMAGACGKFTTAESFEPPTLGDDGLMALIDLFAGREPLGRIYQRLCARGGTVTPLCLPRRSGALSPPPKSGRLPTKRGDRGKVILRSPDTVGASPWTSRRAEHGADPN